LHTRFFSDRLRLELGMDVDRVGLAERFRRLGYRQDPKLAHPGSWSRRGNLLEIRARAFADPVGVLPERTARLHPAGTRIDAIPDVASGEARAPLTLEPAPLGVVWNGRWETRRPVTLGRLPPYVAAAVIATEDTRFYQHYGVDVHGIARAAAANVK